MKTPKSVVLVMTPFYRPGYKAGGPIKSIVNLTEALSDEFEFRVLTGCREMGEQEPYVGVKQNQWVNVDKASVFYSSSISVLWREYWKQLVNGQTDVVYFQGVFDVYCTLVPLVLRVLRSSARRVPVIVFPRGQLAPGALDQKRTKKQLLIKLLNWMPTDTNLYFQATSTAEEKEIKGQFNFNNLIFVAANVANREISLDSQTPKLDDTIRLVFLSRVSPKKNLHYAIERLIDLPPEIKVVYDIYGPVEDEAYWAVCQSKIAQCPANVVVKQCGSILPSEILSVLQKYDVFYFPTRGENYGHVIVEAMAAGLPLLISDQTPWLELASKGIGHAVPLDQPERFTSEIVKYAKLSDRQFSPIKKAVSDYAKQLVNSEAAVEANRNMLRSVVASKSG